MPRNDDPLEVNGTFHAGTGNAVLIEDANAKKHWLPRSQITMDPENPDQYDPVTITLPEWLADKEGLT